MLCFCYCSSVRDFGSYVRKEKIIAVNGSDMCRCCSRYCSCDLCQWNLSSGISTVYFIEIILSKIYNYMAHILSELLFSQYPSREVMYMNRAMDWQEVVAREVLINFLVKISTEFILLLDLHEECKEYICMYTDIHTHIHMCLYIYIYTYMHTYIDTYITYIHVHNIQQWM